MAKHKQRYLFDDNGDGDNLKNDYNNDGLSPYHSSNLRYRTTRSTLFPSISPPDLSPSQYKTSSESNYGRTFSVIDVSYDGQIKSEYEDRSDSTDSGIESDVVAPSSALATLPIFVIGFSSTIVLCGLIMLYSELRERRKFDKDIIMVIQSLSENSSSAFSNRRISESSSLSANRHNGKGRLSSIFAAICPGADHNNNISDLPVCLCDSSDYSSSLCYDDIYHPEYYYFAKAAAAARKRHRQYCNNRFDRSGQPFLCDQNLHHNREIRFYPSDESSLSIASTITKSLPWDDRTRTCPHKHYAENFAAQYNEKSDCKIMELTEIHRVSSGIALESLVELGTISATPVTAVTSSCSECPSTPLDAPNAVTGASYAQDTPITKNSGDNGNDRKSSDSGDDAMNDSELSSILIPRLSVPRSGKIRECNVSAFDAGNPTIAEAMANEDCMSDDNDCDDGDEEICTREKEAMEEEDASNRVNECGNVTREESSLVASAADQTDASSFESSVNTVPRISNLCSMDSFENESKNEAKSPSSVLLLGEGSLVAVAERNGYITRPKQTDSNEASDDDDGSWEMREHQDGMDSIRLSSSSMDASTAMTNSDAHEIPELPDEGPTLPSLWI